MSRRVAPRVWTRSLLLPCLLLAELPAQPEPVSPLVALRSTGLTAAAARPLVEALVQQPLAVRLSGADTVRTIVLDQRRRHDREANTFAAAVGKGATAAQKRLLGSKGARRVDQLRDEMLAVSRDPALSKERIAGELDPRLQELRTLLLPTLPQLLERAPDLEPRLSALRDRRRELREWFELYVLATADLELNGEAQRHFARVAPPAMPPGVDDLDREVAAWILAGLAGGQDQRVLADNELLRREHDAEEFAGTAALNELRFLIGLPLLRIDPKLGAAARDHSRDMETLGFFAHESPVPGKRSPGDRAALHGTSGGAENIAAGHGSGPDAVRGWWYSPGHHRNMLGSHHRTGLGRQGNLWTQMFGG
ncbi:MAG: CAP domain-containing protein [Planctomycetes bacterium]|jgi:uncharacterized protein YkwD|nr:CAP domain-containing protein [Planctomycetota bacterium]